MCKDSRFIVPVKESNLIGKTPQSVIYLKNHVTKLWVGIVKASEARAKEKITTRAVIEDEQMQACSLLQHECQIFIGSKISLSFYFYFFSPLWVQITLGSTSKSLKILQIPAAPLSGMPAAGWCSLWCVKLLKGQEDTRISTLPPIRNGLTSSDRWLLTDGDEELFSCCTPPSV